MRILLAEDERILSDALAAILEKNSFSVDAVYDGEDALDYLSVGEYDVAILDIMMPGLDGISVLRKIRGAGNNIPVIMLTAKSETSDKITGLDCGADDYLTKPFAMGELLARLNSLTRRQKDYMPDKLTMGSVTLDVRELELASGNTIRLSSREAELLRIMMMNKGKAVTTSDIFDRIWKDDEKKDDDIVWVYISYIRQKLVSVNADIEVAGEKGGPYTLAEITGDDR